MAKTAKNFVTRSKFQTPDGQIFLGSINGIYSFHPENVKSNPLPPKVVLTQLNIKNKPYEPEQAIEQLRRLVLSHDENDLSFSFASIHYGDASSHLHRCQLEGYDNEWLELGPERKATYTNLNPGTYTFRAIAANSDGVWNEEGLRLELIIAPAAWQTLWFKALIGLMVLLLAYAIFKNRQHQVALKREKRLAEQSARYKADFLAEVSHEIRTPMNAIVGLSDLALDTPLSPKQSEFLDAIHHSAKNLLAILNDLLDHSKLEAGKFTLRPKPFQIQNLIQHLKRTLSIQAAQKQLKFDLQIDKNLPPVLIGDSVRLNQILTNLLSNAIKYTEQGRVWLSIQKGEGEDNRLWVDFEIGDTGIGIPKDQLETIFDRYSQATHQGARQDVGPSTGLGLSISRQLVEQQGAELQMESGEGKGTILRFSLPFEMAAADTINQVLAPAEIKIEALVILVVEDTPFNQLLMTEVLKKYIPKVEIIMANNGEEALERLGERTVDVVLMDVKMPVMDGYTCAKRIRVSSDPAWKRLPIIGVTANALPEQVAKCRAAGMNEVVTKPIDGQELLSKIQQLTQKERI